METTILIIIVVCIVLFFIYGTCRRKVYFCPCCRHYYDGLGNVESLTLDVNDFEGEKLCDFCKKYRMPY
jgi:hypothetical protein